MYCSGRSLRAYRLPQRRNGFPDRITWVPHFTSPPATHHPSYLNLQPMPTTIPASRLVFP